MKRLINNIVPKIVIDTKAELEEVKDSFSYFHKKTDDLLEFGVEKVMISEKNKDWQILSWAKDVEIIDQLTINLKELIDKE